MIENGFHQPVLVDKVIEFLNLETGKVYMDATVGGGGHAGAILSECGPFGEVICIDRDPHAIEAARKWLTRFPESRYQLIQRNFSHLTEVLSELQTPRVDGVLFDLGVSSFQINEAERGFSFDNDGAPLDMRMSPSIEVTARDLVNDSGTSELAHIFRKYGEENHSYKIARAIEQARKTRPIETSGDLIKVIERVTSGTDIVKTKARIFQALRIQVNNELDALKVALKQAVDCLNPGGRIVVISYHSLEDRIVKNFFRDMERGCTCPPDFPYCVCNGTQKLSILTRKLVRPAAKEIKQNSRSRSAKLRAAKRI